MIPDSVSCPDGQGGVIQAANSIRWAMIRFEKELAQLKQQLQSQDEQFEQPWWEKLVGVFANDPDFEAAMELGREYRQSLKSIVDMDEPPHVSAVKIDLS